MDIILLIAYKNKRTNEEKERQSRLLNYLEKSKNKDIIDWNNFNGHIVAGGFIYAKEEHKFN